MPTPPTHAAPSAAPPPLTLAGERVPQPGHICAFFDSSAEKYQILAPYFTEAIAAGDQVLNVVDRARLDGHLSALRHAHVPVDRAMQSSNLVVKSTEETYIRDGRLELDAVLDMVREAIAGAERDGRCVRTCGEMDWIARHPDALDKAMEYESKVNGLLDGARCTLLCVYDIAAIPSGIVSDILATHQYALINNRLRENPYFVPSDEYVAMLKARH